MKSGDYAGKSTNNKRVKAQVELSLKLSRTPIKYNKKCIDHKGRVKDNLHLLLDIGET